MMVGKDDQLGLSLSLPTFFPHHPTSNLQLNLMLPQSDPINSDNNHSRSFLRGIDVNRIPAAAAASEEADVCSPKSTISSVVSGKRGEREDHQGSDEDADDTSRKKLRLSKHQSAVLEDTFKQHHTLNPRQKSGLAKQLGLRPRQVEVWFQNRRARTKLKQTEVDCEFLKRCCDNLTEENRRLHKQVLELRALKHSPQHLYMQMRTPLTMCPSCDRVGGPPSTSAHQHRPMHHLNQWAASPTNPVTHGALNLLCPRS